MIEPQREELMERLIREWGYPASGARLVADRISRLDTAVLEAFRQWWSSGNLPELTVAGYTVVRLMHEHGMNPIAALLTLDWLKREPAQALASLRSGHDQVVGQPGIRR
jgi:hypothetical protein